MATKPQQSKRKRAFLKIRKVLKYLKLNKNNGSK